MLIDLNRRVLIIIFFLMFSIYSKAQIPDYLPTDSLVCWYPFNGNANDESGNGHDGEVYGATTTNDRHGNASSAYDFETDGNSFGQPGDRIEITPSLNDFDSKPMTINAWVNPESYYWPQNSVHASMIIGSNEDCSSTNLRFQVYENGEINYSEEGFGATTTNSLLVINEWQMITVTLSGSSITFYYNGNFVETFSHNGNIGFVGCMVIGEHIQANGHWYYFDGKIDDLAMWNRVLTSEEILNIYNEDNISPKVEVQGSLKITEMEENNNIDSLVTWNNNGLLGFRNISSIKRNKFYIGQDTLGGIVYYIYENEAGEKHGLIVTKTFDSKQWQSTNSYTGADRTWDGSYNMGQMVNSPAKDYIIQNYSAEWYLPSIDELILLYQNRFHVNKILFNENYDLLPLDVAWSSLENNTNEAYSLDFKTGEINLSYTKSSSSYILTIRKF